LDPGLAEEVRRIEQRVADLEGRIEALDTRPVSVDRAAATEDPLIEELLRRLESLEERTEEARYAGIRQAQEAEQLDAEEMLDQVTSVALDPSETERRRVGALRVLCGRKLADGTDARLAVLDAMIDLGQTALESGHRAEIWKSLFGITDPRLRLPLLNALAHDPDAEPRQWAADGLAQFLPDPTVLQALLWAAEHDESELVRLTAKKQGEYGSQILSGH
jgi:hypothetical protein